jgi:hypothetical protein
VAELVDALASGASGFTAVKVRVLSWAPLPLPMIRENAGGLIRRRRQLAAASLLRGRSPDRFCLIKELLIFRIYGIAEHRASALQIRADRLSLLFRESCPEIRPPLSSGSTLPAGRQKTVERPVQVSDFLEGTN